jgi:predicted TIM-barrel fold metal-dependent hydrolase
MEIIDAQIHDPHPVRPLDSSYGEDVKLLVTCEMAREALDSVGVDIAVVNAYQKYLDFCVDRYPDRFVGCARWGTDVEDVDGFVANYRDRPGMLAIRTGISHWATGKVSDFFNAGLMEPLFAAAEKHRMPLFVGAMGVAKELAPVAEAHPDLVMIVDHLGVASPPPMTRVPDPWLTLPGVLELARYPNVCIKFSGAIALSNERYPHHDLWPYLHRVIDAFGVDRLMWGSDFTRLRMAPGTTERGPREGWGGLYSDSVNYLRDTTEISEEDKAMIFAGSIRRWLRWPKDGE